MIIVIMQWVMKFVRNISVKLLVVYLLSADSTQFFFRFSRVAVKSHACSTARY